MKFSGSGFVMFILLTNCLIIGQPNYWNNYSGIPIIAHTNLTTGDLLQNDSSLSKMVELGVYGFIATDINLGRYNIIKNSGLKIIPYQLDVYGAGIPNLIAYYTDAVYSVWEAEGKGDGSMGETHIEYNDNIGETFTESAEIQGIKTSPNAPSGTLIFGPWYSQRVKYKQIDATQIINYTANYLMKITQSNNGGRLPAGYKDSVVCTLEITVADTLGNNDSVIVSKNVTVRELLQDTTYWGSWDTVQIRNYNFSGLKYLDIKRTPGESMAAKYTTEYVQYKIHWKGLTFLQLWVDKIVIHDFRGEQLYSTSSFARQQIDTLVRTYQDTTNNNVLAWFGANEPASIDNYLCFKKVRDIIKGVNQGLDLYLLK